MKFSCIRDHLERALLIAERFTGKNITLPILGNVLLTVAGNNLTVSATNLEYAIEVSVPGKGGRDDRVSVPAKVAGALIQSLREEKVDLEGKQGNLLIKTPARETRINGMPAEEFPIIPKVRKSHSFSVEGEVLRRGLERVLPVVSTSEFKPELAGVQFLVAGATIRLAATDTFRLAEATLPLASGQSKENFSFILPQRTSQEIARISSGDEEVRVGLGENQAEFSTPSLRVVSRLIEGRFPDYAAIIPKKFATSSFLEKKQFMEAIKVASIFASKMQEINFSFGHNKLAINSANQEVGEYSMEMAAPTSGGDLQTSFNHRYLLDGLNALEEAELFLGTNGREGAALLRNKSNEDFLYVLMPIRLT